MSPFFVNPEQLPPDQREHGDIFAPKFNQDGLIFAITTEKATGQVLMAAYMSEQALQLTVETGIVHYFSRSRQKLWKKGETSGQTQQLVEMRTDCDQDVLLLSVVQKGLGAACHTGHKSCFYRKINQLDGKLKLENDTNGPLFDPKQIYKS